VQVHGACPVQPHAYALYPRNHFQKAQRGDRSLTATPTWCCTEQRREGLEKAPTNVLVTGILPNAAAQALHYSISSHATRSPEQLAESADLRVDNPTPRAIVSSQTDGPRWGPTDFE
jgi:hypothetical protein